MIPIIAIIGPFRADTEAGIRANIARADALQQQVWALGVGAYCPHTMTGHLYGVLPESVFLAGHLEMVRRCDAGILVSDWWTSEGSRAEWVVLSEMRKPVFVELHELQAWLQERAHP